MAYLTFLYLVLILSLYNLLQTNHAIDHKQSGFSLQMFHRNSPELPSYKPDQTREELMVKLVQISRTRYKAIEHLTTLNHSHISSNQVEQMRPTLEPLSSHGVYLVQVGIGTFQTDPTFQQNYLVLDTSSAHTWTQCVGCNPCFPQRGPLFPSSESSTYRLAPCSSCPSGCQSSDHCMIHFEHGTGIAARETLTFDSVNGLHFQIPNSDFICMLRSPGIQGGGDVTQDNVASGAFALGRQGYSTLMRNIQNRRINDGRFSYCLPPMDRPIQTPIYLRFGNDIRHLPTIHHSIKIIEHPRSNLQLYYVKLRDLSVGDTSLGINPRVFTIKQDGSGGCIIDSSSITSHLPGVAYDRLEQVLAQKYEELNGGFVRRLQPSPIPMYPLCYEQLTATAPRSIDITFHFTGTAHIKVPSMGQYMYGGARRLYCLEILAAYRGTTTVIGAMQQVNYRFVFNNIYSKLDFAAEDCALNN